MFIVVRGCSFVEELEKQRTFLLLSQIQKVDELLYIHFRRICFEADPENALLLTQEALQSEFLLLILPLELVNAVENLDEVELLRCQVVRI